MQLFHTQNISIFQLSTYDRRLIQELAADIALAHKGYQGKLQPHELAKYVDLEFDFGVALHSSKGATVTSKCERLKSDEFWYKQLTKISSRARESIAVRNLVVGKSQPYCSDETFTRFIERQVSRGYVTKKNLQLNSERSASQIYLMAKAAARKAFTRNFISVFITLSLDGRYHSSSEKYQGKTFDQGYSELSQVLRSSLEHLSKAGVRGEDFYGVRCVEVHEDGCPHLHINLFMRPGLYASFRDKLRAAHYKLSSEMGLHFDKHEDKVIQVRRRGSLETFSQAIAYLFKSSYAGRSKDESLLTAALRQRAVISVYGKHQYELIGMNGRATIIKEVSRRREVRQAANELGIKAQDVDRRLVWLKVIGAILFEQSGRYCLLKETRPNKFGEPVSRTVGVRSLPYSCRNPINYSLIILAVICNSSRGRSWNLKKAGDLSSIDLDACQNIRAPPKQRSATGRIHNEWLGNFPLTRLGVGLSLLRCWFRSSSRSAASALANAMSKLGSRLARTCSR